MSSTTVQTDDGRIQNRIENYSKFWQKDPNKEQDVDNQNRLESYTEVVNGNYPFSPLSDISFADCRTTQVTMTVQPSCTNTVGRSLSTFLASKRERLSWLL